MTVWGHENNNDHNDGEWIEVVKGSKNKFITAAAVIQNDNTFISLEEDHGPRKTNTTIATTPDATPPSTPSQRDCSMKGKSKIKK